MRNLKYWLLLWYCKNEFIIFYVECVEHYLANDLWKPNEN